MGVDYIKKISKSFSKSLDAERVAAKTPKLFNPEIVDAPCTYSVQLNNGHALSKGDTCVVTLQPDERVFVSKRTNAIGEFISPPERLVSSLRESARISNCTVVRVYKSSNVIEVDVS